jgi:DNA-binding CsgD family transcriptional regulator
MILFGREQEMERVLAVVRNPMDSAMTVIGGRGTGKSSLLAEINHLHSYKTVLLRVNSSESMWPLSGLTATLSGLDDPELSRTIGHLAERSPEDADVSAISARLISALHERTAPRTVLLIDDVDQMDPASQAVIGFLARRLAGTGIVLIASMRKEESGSPFAGLPTFCLPNLSHSNTVKMLEAIPGVTISATAIHAVATATQGIPLAAIELHGELAKRRLQGKYAMPIPLHCNGSFESDLALSVSALSSCARRALDLLSLSYRSSIDVLEELPVDLWSGVDEIIATGVAVHSGSYVRIQNQMLRAHVYSALSPEARLANHRLLADAAATKDPLAWPWHVSHTAVRRDASFGLLRFAVELVRAEETEFAVEYIERALTINPWEAETAARLTTIAEVLFNRGEFVHAKRYLEWAQGIARSRALTLRLTGLDFQIELMRGNSVRPSLVLRLVKEFGHHDPAFSACLLSIAALYVSEHWDLEEAHLLLQHAEPFLGDASGEALAVNRRAKLLAAAVKGDLTAVSRTAAGSGNNSAASLLLKGRALTYSENYEGARDLFAIVRNLSAVSDANWKESARYFAADNEVRSGNFRSAIALVDEIARSESSQKYHKGMRIILLLWRAHAVGDELEAQSCLVEAQRFAAAGAQAPVAARLAACQGQFALMRGDLAEAYAQLNRASELGLGFSNPALLRSEPDLVEVLVRLGHHREAVQALTRLERRSSGLRSRWLQMTISRSRALVTDGEHSLELFAHALEAWTRYDSVFERARTHLCFGERLKTLGRLKDARDSFLRAKALFEETGAAAWTQRVDALLIEGRAEDRTETHNPALLMLSDHERELAQMVARGRRNKEIAALLYVSVRTVEVRLTGIYRKLGVQSRSQLTSLVTVREPLRVGELVRTTSPISV